MKQFDLCFLGFGNVGRALVRLLRLKTDEMRGQFGIEFRVTGVASRRLGWRHRQEGFQVSDLIEVNDGLTSAPAALNISEWLNEAKPDVVFETTSLNHETGQPAVDYLRAVLQADAHAITANKGAVVYGYEELSALAVSRGKKFYFESTVADSAPIFSLFRETLPVANVRAFSGLFSSTCSVILETMEAGRSFDEGVRMAQELGVAETDPSHDVDGWDATVKVCALARVLMRAPLKPDQVRREGIRNLVPHIVQRARNDNKPFKLIARAQRAADGLIQASVMPEQVAINDPLGNVRGTSLAVHFELDMMPGLTITSHRPNLQSTAYGLLADFVNAAKISSEF
jgi:homoserine dehydrogenase